MGQLLYTVLLSALVYLLLFGVAFLVIAAVRWTLLLIFSVLPQKGLPGTLRQVISFPMVALLSRERKARTGHADSTRQLILLQIAIAGALSWAVQGPLVATCCSVLLLVGALAAFRE